MVAIEPWKKHDLWTFDFELQTLQWTSVVEQMITSATWQFSHTFWNGGVITLAMDNTLITWEIKNKKCWNKKIMKMNKNKMWKKYRSIKKEAKKHT